ncbi:uncharacterized protein LOC124814958 [Hydra vulgaris]|uniref:uncharacterized protein LOC124814958 n=1 Tax=Hydra vulgaris TaxID=6087 RepID=UPI001F5F7651|nr:uncharacterized protein LOC124814958 [Hydra vulgaris]
MPKTNAKSQELRLEEILRRDKTIRIRRKIVIYYLVEFEDGVAVVLDRWLLQESATCYWPQGIGATQWSKIKKLPISNHKDWPLYPYIRLLKTGNYEKMKKAEAKFCTTLIRSKHSTCHALISITEKIRKVFDTGHFVCGVFIDLQKAFDALDHVPDLVKQAVADTVRPYYHCVIKRLEEIKSELRVQHQKQVIFLSLIGGSLDDCLRKMKRLLWDGLVNIGVAGEEFYSGSFKCNKGYSARRKIITESNQFDCFCNVLESGMGKPMFECILKNGENKIGISSSLNPTTAAKKILKIANVNISIKSGNTFFGFDREEVVNLMNGNTSNGNTNQEVTNTYEVVNNSCSSRKLRWLGVVNYGRAVDNITFQCKLGSGSFNLHCDYESIRIAKTDNGNEIEIHSKVECENEMPIFKVFTIELPLASFSNEKATVCVKQMLNFLGIETNKKWSGYDFFGFMKPEVLKIISTNQINVQKSSSKHKKCTAKKFKKEEFKDHIPLKNALTIRTRNAGETSSLVNSKSINARNEAIHELVEYISFGDVKSYIEHLYKKHPSIITETVAKTPKHIELSCSQTAELLLGQCHLSQRGYKSLSAIMSKNLIDLPTYKNVREYCLATEVGEITKIHKDNENVCKCMGARTNLTETLQYIISCKKLLNEMEFLDTEKQEDLFTYLKQVNPKLYNSLDSTKRTLFIKNTGDNFRAASRFPTEQTSFSLLNLKKMINSPYGQFITTLWRGSESKVMLEIHVKCHYEDLTDLVLNGINLVTTDTNTVEHFNVLCFFVADLGFLKNIIGLCACTSTYGCYHCLLKKDEWSSKIKQSGEKRSIAVMAELGEKVESILGANPDHDSVLFKKTQFENHGQWTTMLFKGFVVDLMPPCGLHLILAHHRYMYKFMYNVINKRNMDSRIDMAFRNIGCTYLAYQIEQYFKSKKKNYDGSETLKIIGNDCMLLESNIDTFLHSFLADGENWQDQSALKLRQILDLYRRFASLANDVRSTTPELTGTFNERCEEYFQKFITYAGSDCTDGMPYLHYLRCHVGKLMVFYARFGWGYGMFNCNASEHLNKRIKFSELNETNLDTTRFETIIRLMRLQQFILTDSVMTKTKEVVCSACKIPGHNKKNKSCPLHPSHPQIQFDESDEEV